MSRGVTVTNTGNAVLTLGTLSFPVADSAFSNFVAPSYPASLAPGASGTIHFTFTPGTPGISNATMTVNSNAQGSPSTLLALEIETLPNLANGITYRAYLADRPR